MSIILHLETATEVCSVAISENGRKLATIEITDQGYSHGEKLTLLIQEVLQKAEKKLADLSAISVSEGPGSYTGLRIGVSTAKGLCYARNIPLIAVGSLDALIALVQSKYPQQPIAAMFDARRMEVYVKIVDPHGHAIVDTTAAVLDEQRFQSLDNLVLIGDGAPKTKEIWRDRNYHIDPVLPSAEGQIQIAFNKFTEGDFVDLAYFEPFYLKPVHLTKPKSQKIG